MPTGTLGTALTKARAMAPVCGSHGSSMLDRFSSTPTRPTGTIGTIPNSESHESHGPDIWAKMARFCDIRRQKQGQSEQQMPPLMKAGATVPLEFICKNTAD